ncbi:NAD(P)/FAD-dependent oxidoreductase [Rhizobium sp. RAF56]|uniref:NAD(P)/FAD-dependent oxidoreductase n=1 Tax=Rhizobium sp. RAF56 TaxID=3233062 RepID=UPI003F9DB6EE
MRTKNDARIAVIGAGISGLSAAWLMSRHRDVTLYEAADRLGGHANTVLAPAGDGAVAVDTGFIVYNDRNYPNLVALFDHLRVPTSPSDMSFSASIDDGAFEYSGTGLAGLLAQTSNAAKPRFWRMLRDIARFYREAEGLLARSDLQSVTLGQYLERAGYSQSFADDHLLPMGAAIWSTTADDIRAYPLHAFIRFFVHHGLILLAGRPRWRTVQGGSCEYVKRLVDDFASELRLGCPVARIVRDGDGVLVRDAKGNVDRFAEVVIATHANEALAMLDDADEAERDILQSFRYTENLAVLHGDVALMPRRRRTWSSWNYIAAKTQATKRPLCVTYWMNRLQNLDPAHPLFVTLNPCREVRRDAVIGTYRYSHPLFDHRAIVAQKRIWDLQGRRHTWFAGAHFGSGFHEDGLQAGLAVAEALTGARRPWTVADQSGRIFIDDTRAAAE